MIWVLIRNISSFWLRNKKNNFQLCTVIWRPDNALFHQGMHYLLRIKESSGTEIHYNLENSTRDPLKYLMGSPILIVSSCMGKSIRIQRVNMWAQLHFVIFTFSKQGLNESF